MRIVTYVSDRGERAGVRQDGRVVDAWDVLGAGADAASSVRRLLEEDRVAELDDALGDADTRERRPPEGIALAPPIPDPDKIVCMGLNYRSHAAEAGLEPPDSPTFFAKFRNALAPPGAEVALPDASEKVDYEAEVAFVVGRRAKDVAPGEALDHVAGYTLLNDLSARDLQFATSQWMPGKVFDGSAPCGPALVTPDDAGSPDAIEIELALNGERMQRASTEDLVFGVPELVSRLSRLMTLEPGDIVATGTPAGVGSVRKPRVWLRPGDEVSIVSPTLGRLDTRIS
jgi:2-keto-4-pentenoate hydratase/2-oxohepta-3-ene-1,7-dioic acid hydratase in catechol pathway